MTKSRAAFAIWLLVWSVVLFMGIRLYFGVAAQKVPGYPTTGQLELYVAFPSVLFIGNAALIAYERRLPILVRIAAFLIQVPVLLVFIVVGGGGV